MKYIRWGVAGRAEPMDHGCPYAGICSSSLVHSWDSFPAVMFFAQQLAQGCMRWKVGHIGLRERRKEGEKAGIQNHFIVENTKGGNFNKCQMVKINQRHVEPYMSNCLLWQGAFSFLNESLPGALFFSLAFLIPFTHPLDPPSYSTLPLLPLVSSLASHLLLLPMIHVAPQMMPYVRAKVDPFMGTSLLPPRRGIPTQ